MLLTDLHNNRTLQKRLAAIVRHEERPVAAVCPETARHAAAQFAAILEKHDVQGRVFAAHKPTNCTALVAGLRETTGIDVASLWELKSALRAGFEPTAIIATGPKHSRFLAEFAKRPDITVVVDSVGELERFIACGAANPLLLRLTRSCLNMPTVTKTSRFGLDDQALDVAFSLLKTTPHQLRGMAFHFDSQSIAERAEAVRKGAGYVLRAQKHGFSGATVLDIGGGYGNDATRLDDILSEPDVADRLRDYLIELWCEPGKAIFYHAGIVAAEVSDRCSRDQKNQLALHIHRNQLWFETIEPSHLPFCLDKNADEPTEEYVLNGNLCAENDVLHRAPIALSATVKVGDVLVWPDVGAYRANFSASAALGQPLAAQYIYENNELKKAL